MSLKAGNPALAIAYAVKRRNAKKMAQGGMVPKEDMGRNMDPMAPEEENENHDLNPGQGMNPMPMAEERLNMHAQSHEELPEPMEPKKEIFPVDENRPNHMMAKGGRVMMHHPKAIAHAIMKKRMAKEMPEGMGEGMEDEMPMGAPQQMMAYGGDIEENDDFLSDEMDRSENGPFFDSDMPEEQEEEPEAKKKQVMDGIMKTLRDRHYGR